MKLHTINIWLGGIGTLFIWILAALRWNDPVFVEILLCSTLTMFTLVTGLLGRWVS